MHMFKSYCSWKTIQFIESKTIQDFPFSLIFFLLPIYNLFGNLFYLGTWLSFLSATYWLVFSATTLVTTFLRRMHYKWIELRIVICFSNYEHIYIYYFHIRSTLLKISRTFWVKLCNRRYIDIRRGTSVELNIKKQNKAK